MLPPRHPSALVPLLVLAVGTFVTYQFPRFERVFPYVGIVVAAASVPWTGGARSPLLPYLLAPGLTLGLTRGVRGVLLGSGLAALVMLVAIPLPDADVDGEYLTACGQWIVLSAALGLIARWGGRLTAASATPDLYSDVRRLLEQLHGLTRRLPGGLDAPTSAAALLERCCFGIPHVKAAVLTCTTGDAFVPIAVQGTRRVPWRAPLEHPGPLRDAWMEHQPVLDVREADTHGRRKASALLALPLIGSGDAFGLLVIESSSVGSFPPEQIARIQDEAAAVTSQLEAALLFEEVRLAASLEERDRIAREMHDGIAQELAFIGYRLDDLRAQAKKVAPELADLAVEVRQDLTKLISEIRMSITDLKANVRPDRGLGNVLTHYLQAATSGRDIRLTMSLEETAFRLPSDQEVALLQAAQAFVQDVRRSATATSLEVRLRVDPPSAELVLWSDGEPFDIHLGQTGDSLAKIGADVTTSVTRSGGPRLDVVLRGDADADHRATSRRPRPNPARSPSGIRAD